MFQDPLTSLNPLIKIGDQLVETIRTHLPLDLRPRARALSLLQATGIPAAEARWASTRISCRAACGSGW